MLKEKKEIVVRGETLSRDETTSCFKTRVGEEQREI